MDEPSPTTSPVPPPYAPPPAAAYPAAPPYAHVPPAAPPPPLLPTHLSGAGAAAGSPPPPPPGPSASPRRAGRAALVGVTVAASLVAGATGGWVAGRQSSDATTATAVVPSTRTVSATISGDDLDVAAILAKVSPSVVAINTEITQRQGPYVARGQGAGTGVILTADGQVLTNAHVVSGATSITVSINGTDREMPARLVAADTTHDLALLQITGASGLTPATLGNSADTVVGDDVVAVGNALALEGGLSVTRGIVSALHRSIEAGAGDESESLSGLIQTDAAISSGNSGGPLVDSQGQVIGINTAVAGSSGTTTASNIGFAIPIDTAKQIVEQLRRSGS